MEDDSFIDRLCAADNFDDQVEREVIRYWNDKVKGNPQYRELRKLMVELIVELRGR